MLYYDKAFTEKYSKDTPFDFLMQELEGLGSPSRCIRARLRERAQLKPREDERLVEDIRNMKPQSRGTVTASGGDFLPISGSGKLNLQNTPVLVVRNHEQNLAYVFPCKQGEKYYRVSEGLSFLKKVLPSTNAILPAETEEVLLNMIKEHPEELEEGMKVVSLDKDTGRGESDLILSDSKSRYLIVEVEREANDAAVGQVLRLSSGLEEKLGLPELSIRQALVCYRINSNVLAAAKRARIEVWVLEEQKQEFQTSRMFRKLA